MTLSDLANWDLGPKRKKNSIIPYISTSLVRIFATLIPYYLSFQPEMSSSKVDHRILIYLEGPWQRAKGRLAPRLEGWLLLPAASTRCWLPLTNIRIAYSNNTRRYYKSSPTVY